MIHVKDTQIKLDMFKICWLLCPDDGLIFFLDVYNAFDIVGIISGIKVMTFKNKSCHNPCDPASKW